MFIIILINNCNRIRFQYKTLKLLFHLKFEFQYFGIKLNVLFVY